MDPISRPSLYAVIFLLLLILSVPGYGQSSDTTYRNGKVIINNHGIHIYDSLEWRAIQWQRQQHPNRPQALPSLQTPALPLSLSAGPLSAHPARPLNSCGVSAGFTPSDDSIIPSPHSYFTFTSTSTNASSVSWYLNGYLFSTASSISFGGLPVGLNEIELVAQNGACTDTAFCYYYITGSQPPNRDNIKAYYGTTLDQHSNDLAAIPSGGYLLGGYTYSTIYDGFSKGMLVNIAESGCIQWSKTIMSPYPGELYKVLALPDGTFACSGYYDNINYVMKLDASGNPLWTHIYEVNDTTFIPQWIAATTDGGFALVGIIGEAVTVIRTDAGGNILWTKSYTYTTPQTTAYQMGGILVLGQNIYITGIAYPNYTGPTGFSTGYPFVLNINATNGTTGWTQQYSMNGTWFIPRNIQTDGTNLVITTTAGTTVPNANSTIHVLDPNGNPIRSTTLSSPGYNYAVGWSNVLPLTTGGFYVLNSGTEALTLEPGYVYHSIFTQLDASENPVWSLEYGGAGVGGYFFAALGQNNTLAVEGDELGTDNNASIGISYKLMFKKLNDAASDGTFNIPCDFNTAQITTTPESVTVQPFNWTAESSPAEATAANNPLSLYTNYAQVHYECPEFVDSCSFLKLTGVGAVCDLNGNYTYRAHRNGACAEPIQWNLPSNVSLVAQTDSTVTLKFPAFGSYKIGSSLPFACSPIADSMMVIATSSTPMLNLGNDTVVCHNTSFVLHAGTKFLSYRWQDGSADSIYTVSSPGTYIVQISDSCDNILGDTVVVSPYPDTTVNAGPDRVKCNNDTLHLGAPAGYLSYGWSPDYNISAVTTQQVIINPAEDTAYMLQVETRPGCYAYDTVHITVNNSPPIQLGSDRNLCTGDSLILDAGPGFSQYQWNTGASTQQITVYSMGSYSVIASAANGCASGDTLVVPSLEPLPVVGLDHSTGLCTGEPRTLSAAAGNSYLWNTGSTGNSIVVSDTGSYSVVVTDKNGCVNSDSVSITTFLPVPANFLPGDTAICSYGKLDLAPSESFHSYLWSTGSTEASITITKPDLYWLQVTDDNACTGTDSIQITQKNDCMEGFYCPNAFTPNGTSNNVFRPLLFGNINQYEFAVYDRWGVLVFQSNQPGTGWDGNFHGSPATPGVFVWYCRFILNGQPLLVKKGTVILIR